METIRLNRFRCTNIFPALKMPSVWDQGRSVIHCSWICDWSVRLKLLCLWTWLTLTPILFSSLVIQKFERQLWGHIEHKNSFHGQALHISTHMYVRTAFCRRKSKHPEIHLPRFANPFPSKPSGKPPTSTFIHPMRDKWETTASQDWSDSLLKLSQSWSRKQLLSCSQNSQIVIDYSISHFLWSCFIPKDQKETHELMVSSITTVICWVFFSFPFSLFGGAFSLFTGKCFQSWGGGGGGLPHPLRLQKLGSIFHLNHNCGQSNGWMHDLRHICSTNGQNDCSLQHPSTGKQSSSWTACGQ